MKRLEERGVCRVDRIVPNREGALVSVGDYETPYILKNWPAGRECDPRNEEDLQKSMRTLARIHREAGARELVRPRNAKGSGYAEPTLHGTGKAQPGTEADSEFHPEQA